ncbi:MAG: RDD family protein, partial [Saprospiraceae bacterium]|nr:RDD family protein [Saprospiraceae bacterium]
MSEIPILTAQNVAINFVAAPLNKRIIAYLIDYGIKLSYLILIVFYVMTGTISEFMMDPWSENAIFIILLLPYIFYTFSLEWLLEGQTIGKKLMHIKVVKIDGFQASVFDYFVRWGFRVVDIIGSFGLISIFMISSGKYRQRIGDIA